MPKYIFLFWYVKMVLGPSPPPEVSPPRVLTQPNLGGECSGVEKIRGGKQSWKVPVTVKIRLLIAVKHNSNSVNEVEKEF